MRKVNEFFHADLPRPLTAEVVVVAYDESCTVGRLLKQSEADALNEGRNPWYPVTPIASLRLLEEGELVHYLLDCGLSDGTTHPFTSRSIYATTCTDCCYKRAEVLVGWRWKHPDNQEEVGFLKQMLGERVADFAERGETEIPEGLRHLLDGYAEELKC